MRIISGRFRGQKLASFKASHIRPTTDSTKESIFNRLGNIEGLGCLDLFSGSGSLGLEALSRGAMPVWFVEKHPASIRLILKNIQQLGVQKECRVFSKDVFRFLKTTSEGEYALGRRVFDLALVDPPFDKKVAHSVMVSLSESSWLSEESRIVLESSRYELLEKEYGDWSPFFWKDYSNKTVSFWRRGQGEKR